MYFLGNAISSTVGNIRYCMNFYFCELEFSCKSSASHGLLQLSFCGANNSSTFLIHGIYFPAIKPEVFLSVRYEMQEK